MQTSTAQAKAVLMYMELSFSVTSYAQNGRPRRAAPTNAMRDTNFFCASEAEFNHQHQVFKISEAGCIDRECKRRIEIYADFIAMT